MEMESVIEYLENKTILVTGVTGFLGKIFVEKILRVQPNIRKLFLVIRASDSNSVLHRLHSEVIDKELFRVIKEKHGTADDMHTFISEKITPVAGDISLENFGVTDVDLLHDMRSQVDVVVSSAANTNFYERYDVALAINTLSVKHVCSFIKDCTNIKLLLHVSTGERSGVILETPLKMGETLNGKNDLDIEEEEKVMQEKLKQLDDEKANEGAISSAMQDLGIQRAKMHGWPNTYVFTKAMGEMLLFEGLRQDVSAVILRPTIVTSTYREPFPGWIEGVKTIDGFVAAFGRGRVTCFLADPHKVLDIIPADIVINAMIVAMVAHTHKPYSKTIYHVGSSTSNPITISDFASFVQGYFAKHPLISREGNPIIITTEAKLLPSISSFNRYVAIRYMIPLKGLKYASMILGGAFNAWYLDVDQKIKILLRLADLFKPYVLTGIIFDDTNLNKLRSVVRESVKVETTFFFDVKSINWEDYFKNIHIPGLVKYALR